MILIQPTERRTKNQDAKNQRIKAKESQGSKKEYKK
jgi:hypothetical protein